MEKDKIMTLSVNDIGAYLQTQSHKIKILILESAFLSFFFYMFPYLHDLPSGFISLFLPLHRRVLC